MLKHSKVEYLLKSNILKHAPACIIVSRLSERRRAAMSLLCEEWLTYTLSDGANFVNSSFHWAAMVGGATMRVALIRNTLRGSAGCFHAVNSGFFSPSFGCRGFEGCTVVGMSEGRLIPSGIELAFAVSLCRPT